VCGCGGVASIRFTTSSRRSATSSGLGMQPLKSAHLKIDRAEKHISELSQLLKRERPYRYMLETDTKTLQRAVYAKPNESVIDELALIGSDVLHQLRSALDHAFFAIVKARFPQGEGAAQFPFSRDEAGLEGAVKNRCAHRVSADFFAFIMGLKPHGETGGNKLLYMLHEANIVDKHRSFLPAADYKVISSDLIRPYAPDFPPNLFDITIGACGRDVVWRGPHSILGTLGLPGIPLGRKHEFEIPIPVSIRFRVGQGHDSHELLTTLKNLASAVRSVVNAMERFT